MLFFLNLKQPRLSCTMAPIPTTSGSSSLRISGSIWHLSLELKEAPTGRASTFHSTCALPCRMGMPESWSPVGFWSERLARTRRSSEASTSPKIRIKFFRFAFSTWKLRNGIVSSISLGHLSTSQPSRQVIHSTFTFRPHVTFLPSWFTWSWANYHKYEFQVIVTYCNSMVESAAFCIGLGWTRTPCNF